MEEPLTSAASTAPVPGANGDGNSHGNGDVNGSRDVEAAPADAAAAAALPDTAAAAAADAPLAVDPRGHPLDEGGCFVCKRNDKQDLILLCDGCDGEYHTFCVKPPLRIIPDCEWFCDECKAAGKGVPVSKYIGVYWTGTSKVGGARKSVWTAKIRRRSGRKEAIIGSYSSEREAAGAYDAEAKRYFGDAPPPLNFPNGRWQNDPDELDEPEEPEQPQQPQQQPQPQPQQQTESQPEQPAQQPIQQPAQQPVQQAAKEPEHQPEQPAQPEAARPPVEAPILKQEPPDVPAAPVVASPPALVAAPTATVEGPAGPYDSSVGHGADAAADAAAWVDISDVGGQGTSTSSTLGRGANGTGLGVGASAGGGYAAGGGSSHAPVMLNASGGAGVGVGTSQRSTASNGVAEAMRSPSAVFPVGVVSSMQSAVDVHNLHTYGVGSSSGTSNRGGAGNGTSWGAVGGASSSAGTAAAIDNTGMPGLGEGYADAPVAAAAATAAAVPVAPVPVPAAAAGAGAAAAADAASSRSPAPPGPPQLSISIPANGQGAGAEVSSQPSSSRNSNGKQPASARGGDYAGGAGPGDDHAPPGRKRVKTELGRGSSSSGGDSRTTPAGAFSAGNAGTGASSPRGATPTHVGRKKGGSGSGSSSAGGGAGAGGASGGTLRSGSASPRELQKKDKGKAPHRRKGPWGGKDLGGNPLNDAVRDDLLREVTLWSVSQDGTLVGEDGNHFFCSACGESGDLTCCDECPRVFHEECLPAGTASQLAAEHQTEHDPWYCPACTDAGRVNLINGKVPNWTPEDRRQDKRREELREIKRHSHNKDSHDKDSHDKPRPKPALIKLPRAGERRHGLSPAARREQKARRKNPRREAEKAAKRAAEEAAALGLSVAPVVKVNINDEADPPLPVPRVRAFSPELDNVLLRSLLYSDRHTHVLPKVPDRKKSRSRGGAAAAAAAAAAATAAGEAAGPPTTGTLPPGDHHNNNMATDANGRRPRPFAKPEAEELGALDAHLPLSPRAGKRPKLNANGDARRLGPPFAGSKGPGRVIDGTAVTFGARATGPFRAGLAATMVEVGLVPENLAEESGYPEVVDEERAVGREAEQKAGRGGRSLSAFGSASDGWRSRVPSEFRVGTASNGGDSRPTAGGAGGRASPRGGGTVPRMNGAGSGSGNSEQDKPSWAGANGRPPVDPMDVEEVCGAGAGAGGESRPASKARPSSVDREKAPLGKKDPLRKENRMWNLRHMRATGEGKTEVCNYCRLHPDNAVMVCSTPDLAKYHSFCFECLGKNDNVSKSDIVTGSVKWECPTCRDRKTRPKRDSRLPSSLRGAAWEGSGGLTAPGGTVPQQQGDGQQAFGAGGRSKEAERGTAAGGHAGPKRSSSPTEVPARVAAAARETEARRRSASPPSADILSSRSAEGESGGGGGHAFGLRRDGTPRGASGGGGGGGCSGSGSACNGGSGSGVNGGGGGGGGGSVGGSGWPGVHADQVPPGKQSIERRRLLRMVATHALDRLQQLDPLNLFKDPVTGVPGYTEAIEFPIDFSTIGRRSQWGLYGSVRDLALDVQLLCANAMAFNGTGTVYHREATNVLKGAKRIWPQAQKLLDRLAAAEATASRHGIRGPAESSDAWPLDGPFVDFELTPANEDAYYMQVAIRRAAAAARTRAEEEEREKEEERGKRKAGAVSGADSATGVGTGAAAAAEAEAAAAREVRVAAAVKAAVSVASSPAMLYTRGDMGDEESVLRDCLSVFRSDRVEKALRREAGSAKCEPVDLPTWHAIKKHSPPIPTAVTRRFVLPDGEFLEQEPGADHSGPSGPNPKLDEVKGVAPKVGVPEWRVLQSAHGASQRSGREAENHMDSFRGFFKKVAAMSRTRLKVDKSTVQGLGVFATQDIGAHELVAEYVGERVKLGEAEKRVARYRQAKLQNYIVRMGDDPSFIDATRKGNISRFFNHSCDPNLYMLTVSAGKEHAQEKRVCLFSLRVIRAGEELFYSYAAPHNIGLGAAIASDCACRAPGCRGRMSKREEQL